MPEQMAELCSPDLEAAGADAGRDLIGRLLSEATARDPLGRQLEVDTQTYLVDDIMTSNTRTIGRDSLASEAVELLNSAKITMLVVTDGNKPVGILHLHDLLRAGVA